MLKILIPMDGSPGSERAARHAIDVARLAGPCQIHAINVQPDLKFESNAGIRSASEMEPFQLDRAEEATRAGRNLLSNCGIKHDWRFLLGDAAQMIVAYAAA